jgi:phenylpropionate dioxygenase-like ring-hydroxylating dioxygenase large terminal subunit
MKDLPDTDPIAELRACVAEPFERARAMPPGVYTSEAVRAAELERIFRREWIAVGRADALAEPGDYAATEIAGQPVAVVRDRDGRLRAFSNVCLHRMSTLLEGRGRTRAIVCPYHAWTYNLDGSLRGAPAMTLNAAFDRRDYRLPELRCEEWLGFAFVTLNPEAPPLADRLAEAEALIADFGLADYVETFFETHVWDTNWKVLAENFMESYHLPVCHAATIGGLSKLEEMVCPPGRPAFNYHTILKDDRLKIAVAHPSNTRLEGDLRRTTFLLAIYPSLLVTLTPGYFWYLTLHPGDTPGRVRIGFGGGMSPDFVNDPEAATHFAQLKRLLDEVNDEDRGCTEKVFRGLSSGLARPGHLSHLERPNYDFARYLADRIG